MKQFFYNNCIGRCLLNQHLTLQTVIAVIVRVGQDQVVAALAAGSQFSRQTYFSCQPGKYPADIMIVPGLLSSIKKVHSNKLYRKVLLLSSHTYLEQQLPSAIHCLSLLQDSVMKLEPQGDSFTSLRMACMGFI